MNISKWRPFVASLLSLLAREVQSWPKTYLFRRPLIFVLVGWVLCLVLAQFFGFLDQPGRQDPLHWAGDRLRLTGRVADLPDPRPQGCQYILDLETVTPLSSYQVHSVRGKTLLYVAGASKPTAVPGDRLVITGVLRKPKQKNIPGTFDYGTYLASKGIHTVVYTSERFVKNTGDAGSLPWKRWGWELRQYFLHSFDTHLSPEQASVLGGLVVGRRPRFHPEIRKIFIESGTMHILVASGSNIAFVVALWFFVAHVFLRLSRRLALVSSLPIIWAYVLIVGADPPIFRAGVMSTMMVLSLLLAREDRLFHAWSVSALLLLLYEPRLLFDLGFQMSFVSVFGLLYFLPHIDPVFQRQNVLWRWVGRIVAATATAQVWLFPISAAVFKKFFPISLLANVVVLPLSGVGLFMGFLLVFMDRLQIAFPFVSFLFEIIKLCTQAYTSSLIVLVRTFATVPGWVVWMSPLSGLFWASYYIVCFAVPYIKTTWLARFTCTAGFLILLIVGCQARYEPPASLRVTWLDMGRHLTVLIETKEGQRVLLNPYESSKSNQTERTLLPFLMEKRIRSLDALIITATTKKGWDHLDQLTKAVKVKKIISLDENDKQIIGGLHFTALRGAPSFSKEIPLLLTYKERKVVFSHLLSIETQYQLMPDGPIDVIQSRFSPKIYWNKEFIQTSQPKIAVETGLDNTTQPSAPPWKKTELIVPQKKGWWVWED